MSTYTILLSLILYLIMDEIAATGLPAISEDVPLENEINTYNFPFTSRAGWQAREPKDKTLLKTPVPYIVIHHSFIPPACYNHRECTQAMQSMQNYHMDDKGWWDIGYNFAVGSDGVVYEGRGWELLGAHTLHFNTVSLGICLIGDWRHNVPPPLQIKTAQALIAAGVKLGYVRPDYKLIGCRQVRPTESPGEALFQNLKQWDHYSKFPSSASDLQYIEEIGRDSPYYNGSFYV